MEYRTQRRLSAVVKVLSIGSALTGIIVAVGIVVTLPSAGPSDSLLLWALLACAAFTATSSLGTLGVMRRLEAVWAERRSSSDKSKGDAFDVTQ